MNESESSSPESPAKEQLGEQEAMVKRLRVYADTHSHMGLLCRDAAAMIEKLGQKWIPVEERLPEEDGTPLYLLHRNGAQWTGCMQTDHPGFEDTYKEFRYFTDEAEREIWEHGDITHWRFQLPPPPERP